MLISVHENDGDIAVQARQKMVFHCHCFIVRAWSSRHLLYVFVMSSVFFSLPDAVGMAMYGHLLYSVRPPTLLTVFQPQTDGPALVL